MTMTESSDATIENALGHSDSCYRTENLRSSSIRHKFVYPRFSCVSKMRVPSRGELTRHKNYVITGSSF
jgi:hypothetical protein